MPALPAQRNAEPLLVEGAARAFGGVRAVDGVDLTVEPGTVYGLIGSNGSGKTTLLNLISGYYKLDAGRIAIGPKTISGKPTHAVARLGVARTFQTPKLMTSGTVLENLLPAAERRVGVTGPESVLRLPRGIRGGRAIEAIARDALDRLALGHLADEDAAALPHGTRRLVEIARAVALHPRFVMLDEPAAGLSPVEAEVLIEVIQQLAESGVGVLLVEHNVPMVLELASQVTVMHQGQVLFQGTPSELRSNDEVAGAFLGIDVETEHVG